ncbi:MAG TPA: SEC-C metal-binding domain-containing protein [Polyangia bacterium]|jgi:hypothetical protein
MQTYALKITPWRDGSCSRTIEFLASHSLGDVHTAIQRELDLDDDHLWAFYLSGDLHDAESEFVGDGVSRGRAAWGARLESLDLVAPMRFLYRFDFGDELMHDVEVVALADQEPGAEYPRVVARTGTPPPQYPRYADETDDEEEAEADDPVAAEDSADARTTSVPQPVVAQFRAALDLWLDLPPGEPPGPEALAASARLADLVLDTCPTHEALHELSSAVEDDVLYWLPRFVEGLAQAGQTEAALRIADRLAGATNDPGHHDLAVEVLRAGARHDEALARLAQIQHHDQTEADLLRVRVAQVLFEKGDHAAAEEELRRLLGRRWLSGRVREDAVPLLGAVLRAAGREQEAQALERERREQLAAAYPEVPRTVRRDGPKVGRNDPCPCGSGKKYKKCCGG